MRTAQLGTLATATIAVWVGVGSALAAVPARTSEDYGLATYRERSQDLTLLVSTNLASQRADEAFIPFPIAVGLRGKGGEITVTPESFTLVDSTGRRYPVADLREVREKYQKLNFDRDVLRAQPLVVGLQFSASQRVRSSFFPSPSGGLRIDHITLGSLMWFSDVLYFPRPANLDGPLTLEFRPQGREEQVFARIMLPKMSRSVAPDPAH